MEKIEIEETVEMRSSWKHGVLIAISSFVLGGILSVVGMFMLLHILIG